MARPVALCIAFLLCAPAAIHAQILRGTVRVTGTDRTVAGVRIAAMDSLGLTLLEVVSDERGRFTLALVTDKPFRIVARKIGLEQSVSDFFRLAPSDTLALDLQVPTDAPALPTVEVGAERPKSPNERSLDDAVRHGWKVYSPAKVAEFRDKYRDFPDMLRALQVSGIRVGRPGECIQSMRFMNRCLAYVIDGTLAGPSAIVVPSDVYFFAVLSATESAVRWGDRAPWGAIVIYTRMNGDRLRP